MHTVILFTRSRLQGQVKKFFLNIECLESLQELALKKYVEQSPAKIIAVFREIQCFFLKKEVVEPLLDINHSWN